MQQVSTKLYIASFGASCLHCATCMYVRPDQFDFSFHGPDRSKILGIKKKKKKRGVAMHGQIAAVRGYSLRLPQCSLQPLSGPELL